MTRWPGGGNSNGYSKRVVVTAVLDRMRYSSLKVNRKHFHCGCRVRSKPGMGFDVKPLIPVLQFGPLNAFRPEPGAERHPAGRRVVDPVTQFQPENPEFLDGPAGYGCCRPRGTSGWSG